MIDAAELIDNDFLRQFELKVENKLAKIEYSLQERKIFLTKLIIPEAVFTEDFQNEFRKQKQTEIDSLINLKKEIENNFVDLYVPSNIAASNSLSKLINKIQKISRKIEPNIYDEENFLDKDFYDLDEIEDLYKNYNILHLCNLYVEGLNYDEDMKTQIKARLKQLHDQCAYNYDIS